MRFIRDVLTPSSDLREKLLNEGWVSVCRSSFNGMDLYELTTTSICTDEGLLELLSERRNGRPIFSKRLRDWTKVRQNRSLHWEQL